MYTAGALLRKVDYSMVKARRKKCAPIFHLDIKKHVHIILREAMSGTSVTKAGG